MGVCTSLLLGGVMLVGTMTGSDEARALLDRMSLAINNLNYSGVIVYSEQDRLETMQVFHRVDDGDVRERLVSLSGTAREVLRDGDAVRCIIPERGAVMIDQTEAGRWFPTIPAAETLASPELYEFGLGGYGRVAGHRARIVQIKPRDALRYGYKLWLEEETGMLLKSVLTDERGEPLESMMFTQIELGADISDQDLQPAINGEGFRQVTMPAMPAVEPRPEKSQWAVADVPDGFRLTARRQAEQGGSEHLVYSDGLASVSVYIEPQRSTENPTPRARKIGALNAYSVQRDGFNITAIGEVPGGTVHKMATSVRKRQ